MSLLRKRLKTRLLVTLKSGDVFDGVLFAVDRSCWVLRNATAVGAGRDGAPVPLDGEVVLLTADVAFAQRP